MKAEQHWNNISGNYSSSWEKGAKKWMNAQELDFITSNAQEINLKEAHYLDIGSGNGRILSLFADKDIKSINSVDISEEMVAYLRDKFPEHKKNINKIDSIQEIEGKEKHDLITSIRVLKYSADWKEDLAHVVSLLKTGGIFIFTMPNKNSVSVLTPYPIKKYKTSAEEITSLLATLPVETVALESKFRLPDFLYEIALLKPLVIAAESVFATILPKKLLGKIFFIAIKRV